MCLYSVIVLYNMLLHNVIYDGWISVTRENVLVIILVTSNKIQQYAGIYLLQNHSVHVSGVHRTHHQENITL